MGGIYSCLFAPKNKKVEGSWNIEISDADANTEKFGPRTNKIKTNKYTILTFLPRNLFEQFHRLANVFFLFMGVIALIPATQALNPETAAAPLLTVLFITAIRDGVEDRRRAHSDKMINGIKAHVLKKEKKKFSSTEWANVKVGQVVRVDCDEAVPADILIIGSSNKSGICHIETANLDGESNLKVREAHQETFTRFSTLEEVCRLEGTVTVPPPNLNMFALDGSITVQGEQTAPFGLGNCILRGCTVRNTEEIYGVVLYTGHDSKIMLNSSPPRLKRTVIDNMMNNQILGVFAILGAMCIALAIFASVWGRETEPDSWYIDAEDPTTMGIVGFFAYVLLLHSMVPLSCYVSVELVKLAHAFFVGFDLEMYDESCDTPALARTSALSEELGMIRYLCSDKTGTITQNIMEFAGCTIDGELYGLPPGMSRGDARVYKDCPHSKPMPEFKDNTLYDDIRNKGEKHLMFMLNVAMCNDVIPERRTKTGNIEDDGPDEYHAQSPDEVALARAARDLGVSFYHRDNNGILYLNVFGEIRKYQYLNNIEFSSDRKRMTVFVKRIDEEEENVLMLIKGADDVILSLLSDEASSEAVETTKDHLMQFAKTGLRTLCMGYRIIDQTEYDQWAVDWKKASIEAVGSDQEAQVEELAAQMEKDLHLLGATAVDDKLQEGAPDTIAKLKKAGISVWVLTGDKQETAVSIGYAINLLSGDLEIVYVNADDKLDAAQILRQGIDRVGAPVLPKARKRKTANPWGKGQGPGGGGVCPLKRYAIVIDGLTLQKVFDDEGSTELFAQLAAWSTGVVCCRTAPMQKALVVRLVRKRLRALTMAIGDGANDVSMIKMADIGVGISGKEGKQAVLASDYAISKFRYLERLLLVHGRWSYNRVTWVVLYFFYKNYAYILVNFWFAWFCAASASTIYDQRYIMLYNIIFTSIPGLITGTLDQDVSDKGALSYPQLYRDSQRNARFSHPIFWSWIADSFWQSLVIFGIPVLAWSPNHDGLTHNLWEVGTVQYSAVIFIVNLKLLMDSQMWTKPLLWATGLSVLAYVAFLFAFHSILPDVVASWWAVYHLLPGAYFWLCFILTIFVALAPSLLVRFTVQLLWPSAADIVREKEFIQRRDNITTEEMELENLRPTAYPGVFDDDDGHLPDEEVSRDRSRRSTEGMFISEKSLDTSEVQIEEDPKILLPGEARKLSSASIVIGEMPTADL